MIITRKTLFLLLAGLLTVGGASSCIKIYQTDNTTMEKSGLPSRMTLEGSGLNFNKKATKSVKKEISLGQFNRLKANQGIEIVGDFSATGKVLIETTPEAASYLKAEVHNGTLQLYYDFPQGFSSDKAIATRVTLPLSSLTDVELQSAASLEVKGEWKESGKVEIELTSASSLQAGSIECQELDLETTSASGATLGTVKGNLDVESTSASRVTIAGVTARKAEIEATSTATVSVKKLSAGPLEVKGTSAARIALSGVNCQSLEVEATSNAYVEVAGKWETVSQSSSSNGSVQLKN